VNGSELARTFFTLVGAPVCSACCAVHTTAGHNAVVPENHIRPDPTYADAILDRIVHNTHRINLAGHSLRRSRAATKLAKD
jgi:hypothetical protein